MPLLFPAVLSFSGPDWCCVPLLVSNLVPGKILRTRLCSFAICTSLIQQAKKTRKVIYMGYDQYTVPDAVTVEPTFVTYLSCYSFQTTHNTFRNCRVHFFRQPFSTTFLEIAIYTLCVSFQS